jgi:hypothetical protein
MVKERETFSSKILPKLLSFDESIYYFIGAKPTTTLSGRVASRVPKAMDLQITRMGHMYHQPPFVSCFTTYPLMYHK